ncbi:Dual specificity protein phosphatase 15 [Anopheles sinensis]|uniref:Dual specificity protein phosphatase 15 n=1 Tax=Anopheles sinensis TaxID=74873 RepID=A0A084W8S3_ANOSI|nr:Dual specificity protein phosphatase 15 [Anopheles sinensis]
MSRSTPTGDPYLRIALGAGFSDHPGAIPDFIKQPELVEKPVAVTLPGLFRGSSASSPAETETDNCEANFDISPTNIREGENLCARLNEILPLSGHRKVVRPLSSLRGNGQGRCVTLGATAEEVSNCAGEFIMRDKRPPGWKWKAIINLLCAHSLWANLESSRCDPGGPEPGWVRNRVFVLESPVTFRTQRVSDDVRELLGGPTNAPEAPEDDMTNTECVSVQMLLPLIQTAVHSPTSALPPNSNNWSET